MASFDSFFRFWRASYSASIQVVVSGMLLGAGGVIPRGGVGGGLALFVLRRGGGGGGASIQVVVIGMSQ